MNSDKNDITSIIIGQLSNYEKYCVANIIFKSEYVNFEVHQYQFFKTSINCN